MLLLTLITGAFVGMHFLANAFDYGIYVYVVVLLVAIGIGWRMVFPKTKAAVAF
ncbi:MAG: hypothetical protein L0G95_06560 [Planococcus sp. (in: firmicutes)]|nr:hypothetical protein [Planococcus sp. (in: firmicutes)]